MLAGLLGLSLINMVVWPLNQSRQPGIQTQCPYLSGNFRDAHMLCARARARFANSAQVAGAATGTGFTCRRIANTVTAATRQAAPAVISAGV